MKSKKLIAMMVSSVASLALLTGCGGTSTSKSEAPSVVESTPYESVIESAPASTAESEPESTPESENVSDKNASADILVSWADDSDVKAQVMAFVEAAIDPNSDGFIPESDRIVVSDIDGTLIPEKGKKINNDSMTAYSPTECREYLEGIKDTAFDATKGYVYGDMLYAPMEEMFDYLYANGFDIYFVSGNYGCLTYAYANYYFDADYLHCVGTEPNWSSEIDANGKYSVIQNQYDIKNGNWGDMKAYRFWDKVGKIPVLGFGNSDGDVQLLQWTNSNPNYPSLSIMINHDDEREYVYNVEQISGFCADYNFLDCLISKNFKEITK